MANQTITTAAQLIDPVIHMDAPLYALRHNDALSMVADQDLKGQSQFPNFPITNHARLIDPDRQIRLEPLVRPLGMEDWAYARITTPQEHVCSWFFDYTYNEDVDALLPEMFVWGELVVSERVKDLIADFAPEYCYFSPMDLTGKRSGTPHPTPYFKVLIRHALKYIGSDRLPYRKEGARRPVNDKNWSALCQTPAAVDLVSQLPIFIFGRNDLNPILNAALYRHLKAHDVSGLIEYTDASLPGHAALRGFETVSPLNPGPDVPFR